MIILSNDLCVNEEEYLVISRLILHLEYFNIYVQFAAQHKMCAFKLSSCSTQLAEINIHEYFEVQGH